MALTKVKLIADGVITSANLDASHGITTSDIGEGSNLYYTDSRVSSYLSTNGFATQTDIVAAITDSAPVTLDTLNELAAALGDDPNFATTTATSLGLKAPLASPSFTGNAIFNGNVTLSQPTNGSDAILNLTSKSGAGNSRTSSIEYDADNEYMYFKNAGATVATMTSGGNVGIGDDSPQGKLEVNNRNTATGAALFIKGGEDDLSPVSGQYTGLAFGYGGGDIYNNAAILWEFTNTAANGKLHFAVNSTAGDGTANLSDSKMTILDSGNVGIGTTTPGSYDTALVGSDHKFLNVQASSTNYAVQTLAGNSGTNGNRLGYLTFVNDNNNATYKYSAWIGSEVEGTTANKQGGRLILSTTSDNSTAGPIERMRIDSSGNTTFTGDVTVNGSFTSQGIDDNADATAITINGNEEVGIGTLTPFYKLDVNGTFRASGNATFAGDVMPAAENAHNIGSAAVRWEDLYVDDGFIRDAYIDTNIYHNGDTDTYINFTDDTIKLSTAGGFGFELDSNRDINSPDRLYMRQTRFGYSSSYKVVQFGNAAAESGISLGYNPIGNTSGNFSGNEILIPNNIRILAPNAANNAYYGLMILDSNNKLKLGSSNFLIESNYIMAMDPTTKRVGIGTDSPAQYLHIKSTTSGPTGIIIENTNNAQSLDLDFWSNAGAAQGRIRYNEGAGSFDFSPNVGAGPAMTMLYEGNVGIGNTTPSSFHNDANNLVVGTGSSMEGITIYSGTDSHGGLYFADGTSGSEAYRGFITYNQPSDYFALGTAGSEKMRITSAGDVGIGNTSPSYKLSVNGSFYSNSVTTNTYSDVNAPTPAYVGKGPAAHNSGGKFRLGAVESSSSTTATNVPVVTTYSSGHWGSQPTFFLEFTVTYYRPAYIKYFCQHEVSSTRMDIIEGPYGTYILSTPLSVTVTQLCTNCHGGQPVYKAVWEWSNNTTYIKTSPFITMFGNPASPVYTDANSNVSALDTLYGGSSSPGNGYLLHNISNAQAAGHPRLSTQT